MLLSDYPNRSKHGKENEKFNIHGWKLHSHLGNLGQRQTNRDNAGVDVDGPEVGEEVFKLKW